MFTYVFQFYGVIPEDRVAHLKEQLVARCPVCAALAVRFASLHTSWGSANASNTDFVGVLPVLCGVVQSAAEAHPAVHAHCLAALKVRVCAPWSQRQRISWAVDNLIRSF